MRGWQDGLELCALASKLSSLGLNPDPAPAIPVFQRQCDSSVCRPLDDVKLSLPSVGISWWTLEPTMSFLNSRQGITSTMNKFQIPAIGGIASAAQPHPQPQSLVICCYFVCSLRLLVASFLEVPLPVSWYSFCQPQKDDRLSQPTWC